MANEKIPLSINASSGIRNMRDATNPDETEDFKKKYYFQCKETFFHEENVQKVLSCAEENGDNPNDYYIFWLKIILDSLEKDGCIWKESYEPLNNNFFRTHLEFRTDKSVKETNELIDRIVVAFEKEKLIAILDDGRSLKIPCVKGMTMNKKEESDRIREYRLHCARLDRQYNSKLSNFIISDEDDFEFYFDKTFGALCYFCYTSSKERQRYYEMLKLLHTDFKNKYLDIATEDFINLKVANRYIEDINDKLNYMKVTLTKFCSDPEKLEVYEHVKMTRKKINEASKKVSSSDLD